MLRRLVISLVVAALSSFAQNPRISVPDQALSPGQTVIASLSLASAGQTIAAIQFDLQWNGPVSLQFTPGDQIRQAAKLIYNSPQPQALRWVIVGFNQSGIADGELLRIFLSAGPSSSALATQVKIANVIASDPNGAAIPVEALPFNVVIQSGTPSQFLPAGAIVNAASLSPGSLSPGEIITLFGFNALPPSSFSLQIDGAPAPVLYAGASQVNAIVPFGINLTSPAQLQLQNANQSLNLSLPVAPASPAIFAINSDGLGIGTILNQDYTVNAYNNPAPPGSIVQVFGTGFGALQSPVPDGQTVASADLTASTVTATVAGVQANVLYAGAAPGEIAGLMQINVQLPAGLAHNLTAPLVLAISGSSTSAGITVAIQ